MCMYSYLYFWSRVSGVNQSINQSIARIFIAPPYKTWTATLDNVRTYIIIYLYYGLEACPLNIRVSSPFVNHAAFSTVTMFVLCLYFNVCSFAC